MISRQPLKCDACGTRIVTRTAIRHGDSQVHSFPCPDCGVGISYRVILDQASGGISYDPEPEHASWVESEHGAGHEVTFDSELLLPEYAVTTPYVSPFIAATPLLKDIAIFQQQEAVRLSWRKNIWPETMRLPVHYANENWHLFDADAKKIEEELYVVKASGTARAFFVERVSAPLCG